MMNDDLISRQAAIYAAMQDVSDKRTHEFNAGATRAANRIKSLPSAQPKQTDCEYCHIMRPNYIGQKVVYDCSTQNHRWYRVGILEKYIPHEGHMRSIIFVGERQRILLDHVLGREIYEPLQWEAYPERMKAIFGVNYEA